MPLYVVYRSSTDKAVYSTDTVSEEDALRVGGYSWPTYYARKAPALENDINEPNGTWDTGYSFDRE